MGLSTNMQEDQLKYSKLLSSLFCSVSIIALSILSLLNNLSIDLYSMFSMLKVVVPAAFCFWFLGLIIGKILDGNATDAQVKKEIKKKAQTEIEAYQIPSMFGAVDTELPQDDMEIL